MSLIFWIVLADFAFSLLLFSLLLLVFFLCNRPENTPISRAEKVGSLFLPLRGGNITAAFGHSLYVLRTADNKAHVICGQAARALVAATYPPHVLGDGSDIRQHLHGATPYNNAMRALIQADMRHSYQKVGGDNIAPPTKLPRGIACQYPCCAKPA